MSFSEMQAKVKASIWQAVAQSGVDVSSISQPEMDKLVGTITEGILRDVDDLLDQVTGTSASMTKVDEADDEKILWEGRPFLSISIRYQITNERVRVVEGILGKQRHDIELVRIQDIDHKQNLTERAFNMGDVFIRSHDVSDPEIVLNNVTDPEKVHEILRRAVLKSREKHHLTFREEM